MAKVYRREKDEAGQWKYVRVNLGAGRRAAAAPPYYLRYMEDGRRKLSQPYPTFEAVREAYLAFQKRAQLPKQRDAAERISIRDAVDVYLEQKANKRPRTVRAYHQYLNQFAELCGVHYLDEISVEIMRAYKVALEKLPQRGGRIGLAPATIDTRVNIVNFMLKKNKIEARVPADEMPTVAAEKANPFTEQEIKKLLAAMDSEDKLLYSFFLGTGCRDQEVRFAAWKDIDFEKETFRVTRKPDAGFVPKNHEERTMRLPHSVIALLKQASKSKKSERWIFADEHGQPKDHFLRNLKYIALRAGMNCGHCKTTLTIGHGKYKKQVAVTCATHPVCEHFYLHRLRATCATRWSTPHGKVQAVPVRTIQDWLGHKNLETTMIYLGVISTDALSASVNAAYGD